MPVHIETPYIIYALYDSLKSHLKNLTMQEISPISAMTQITRIIIVLFIVINLVTFVNIPKPTLISYRLQGG